MPALGLAAFIDRERLAIVSEWVAFARSLTPASDGMTASALRDHADEILSAIVYDMNSHQTAEQEREKSHGRGHAQHLQAIGEIHATLRLESGFNVNQLFAEYRALRASVLRLWAKDGVDPSGVARFNEAIDEAVSEAIARFSEATERYRDQSLGILGHDLRNPLHSIILISGHLRDTGALDERSARMVELVWHSGNRMDRMIHDLLDLTRTRFGHQIPVTPVPTDLASVCTQVVAELESFVHPGRIKSTAVGDLRGEWDSDRIAQVLSNLVRNALQHGAESGVVELTALDKCHEVWLRVHNTGPAIPDKNLKTMFDPMVRHPGERRSAGLGLGLYVASQIVMAHGGGLEVISTVEGGTTFTVRLPRRSPARQNASLRSDSGGEGLTLA